MQYLFYFLLFIPIIYQTHAEKGYNIPPYITPCNFKKVDFETCVKEQIEKSLPLFTKGVPELHVVSIDPLNLDDIIVDGSGLKLTFTNASLHGISDCELSEFKVDLGKAEETFKLVIKGNLSLIAKYEADGQILILPIKGKGDATIQTINLQLDINSKLIHVNDSKGGDHLKLATPNYKYEIESTTFDLKNLFNGNKQLAETTLQFANENWKQLMDDLAPPVVKQIVRVGIKVINKFFSKVTIDQIIENYSRS